MGLFEDAIDGLKNMAKAEGNVSKLADKLEESPSLLSRWFDGSRKPNWSKLSSVLERVGVRLHFPSEKGGTHLSDVDPLAQRVDSLASAMRAANVAELEILRAVRSMMDAEIEKVQGVYQVKESPAAFPKLHEKPAEYKGRRLRLDTDEPQGGKS